MTLIIEHNAVQAYIDMATKGGFTVQGGHGPEGLHLAPYQGSGFAVSLPDYETRIKAEGARNKTLWLGVMEGLEDIRRRLDRRPHSAGRLVANRPALLHLNHRPAHPELLPRLHRLQSRR